MGLGMSDFTLGEVARTAFEKAKVLGHPNPWDEAGTSVAIALISTPAQSHQDRREGAFVVAGAWLAAVGEKALSEALTHGALTIHEGEPFFVLRGQDRLAPDALSAWINAAEISGVDEAKIDSARGVWESMLRWSGDRKYPD